MMVPCSIANPDSYRKEVSVLSQSESASRSHSPSNNTVVSRFCASPDTSRARKVLQSSLSTDSSLSSLFPSLHFNRAGMCLQSHFDLMTDLYLWHAEKTESV